MRYWRRLSRLGVCGWCVEWCVDGVWMVCGVVLLWLLHPKGCKTINPLLKVVYCDV